MNRSNARIATVVALTFAGISPAFAEQGPWGTPEEAKPCQASLDSPACKAEIARRAENCFKDPREEHTIVGGKEKFPNDPAKARQYALNFCADVATDILKDQLEDLAKKEKRAEGDKAKLEAQELPAARMHDPKLEKAVAVAYAKDYPDGKVIKVILGEWSSDYEKDAFGKVTGRDLDATVVNKQPDGGCQLHNELLDAARQRQVVLGAALGAWRRLDEQDRNPLQQGRGRGGGDGQKEEVARSARQRRRHDEPQDAADAAARAGDVRGVQDAPAARLGRLVLDAQLAVAQRARRRARAQRHHRRRRHLDRPLRRPAGHQRRQLLPIAHDLARRPLAHPPLRPRPRLLGHATAVSARRSRRRWRRRPCRA